MVCRTSCKPTKQKEKPIKCQCNLEPSRSEAIARQDDRANVRTSENTEGRI